MGLHYSSIYKQTVSSCNHREFPPGPEVTSACHGTSKKGCQYLFQKQECVCLPQIYKYYSLC